jgi:hypothetical protein
MSFWTKTSRRNNGKQQCLAAATTFFIPPARFPRNWSVINRFISTDPKAEDMSDKDSLGSFTPGEFLDHFKDIFYMTIQAWVSTFHDRLCILHRV